MKPACCFSVTQSPLYNYQTVDGGFPGDSVVKNPPANAGNAGDLGQEDPLEEEMATHSSILAWRIPWTKKPGGLQSRASQRVGHN